MLVNLGLIIAALSMDELTVVRQTSKGLDSGEGLELTRGKIQCGAFAARVHHSPGGGCVNGGGRPSDCYYKDYKTFKMFYDNEEVSPRCDDRSSTNTADYKAGCWQLDQGELISLRSYGCWYFFFALCSIFPLGWACCGRNCSCCTCGPNGQYTSIGGMVACWALQFVAFMSWTFSPANDEMCWKVNNIEAFDSVTESDRYVPDCNGCFTEELGSSLVVAMIGGGFAFLGVLIVLLVLVSAVADESQMMEDIWQDICCDDGAYYGTHSGFACFFVLFDFFEFMACF